MIMERKLPSSIRKKGICLINVFEVVPRRWMVISQVLQGLIILAVGYTYRSLKKMGKIQGARSRLGINHNEA